MIARSVTRLIVALLALLLLDNDDSAYQFSQRRDTMQKMALFPVVVTSDLSYPGDVK